MCYSVKYLLQFTFHFSWDVDNVAFKLTDPEEKTFDYMLVLYSIFICYEIDSFFPLFRISSKNNGRQYRGKSSYIDDPHVQKIIVPDRHECYLFQTIFTDDELNSSETIYKQLNESLGK